MAQNLPDKYQNLAPLAIVDVRDAGDLTKERLLMKATSDIDISEFIVIPANRSGENVIMNYNRLHFWFPKRFIANGEYVRLYTRSGGYNVTVGNFRQEIATFHNFYWNLNGSVWQAYADTAAIVRISTWMSKQVN